MLPTFTYNEYIDVYGGVLLSQDEWAQYSRQAVEFINELSAGRLLTATLTDKQLVNLKLAIIAIAEYDYRDEQRIEKERIASESVDGHSRSYNATATNKTKQEVYDEKVKKAMAYLLPTNLLYRGI